MDGTEDAMLFNGPVGRDGFNDEGRNIAVNANEEEDGITDNNQHDYYDTDENLNEDIVREVFESDTDEDDFVSFTNTNS